MLNECTNTSSEHFCYVLNIFYCFYFFIHITVQILTHFPISKFLNSETEFKRIKNEFLVEWIIKSVSSCDRIKKCQTACITDNC